MWSSYILQEFFRKLKTHDSFPKMHTFMSALWAQQHRLLISPLHCQLEVDELPYRASDILPCLDKAPHERMRTRHVSHQELQSPLLNENQFQDSKQGSTSNQGHTENLYTTVSPDSWRLCRGFSLMSSLEVRIPASGRMKYFPFIFVGLLPSVLKAPEKKRILRHFRSLLLKFGNKTQRG